MRLITFDEVGINEQFIYNDWVFVKVGYNRAISPSNNAEREFPPTVLVWVSEVKYDMGGTYTNFT